MWLLIAMLTSGAADTGSCGGESVDIEGETYRFGSYWSRGNGVFGVGDRGWWLRDPETCEGPHQSINFGAGSPWERAHLWGEPTTAQAEWLLAQAGFQPHLGGAADLLADAEDPDGQGVWQSGQPLEARVSWRPAPCGRSAEKDRCWTVFDGAQVQYRGKWPLDGEVDLLYFSNAARARHGFFVLHDRAQNRHAVALVAVGRLWDATRIAGPGGVWFQQMALYDGGSSFLRISPSGAVHWVRVDEGQFDRADVRGVYLRNPEQHLSWSDLLARSKQSDVFAARPE